MTLKGGRAAANDDRANAGDLKGARAIVEADEGRRLMTRIDRAFAEPLAHTTPKSSPNRAFRGGLHRFQPQCVHLAVVGLNAALSALLALLWSATRAARGNAQAQSSSRAHDEGGARAHRQLSRSPNSCDQSESEKARLAHELHASSRAPHAPRWT